MTDYLILGFRLLNKNIEVFFISAMFWLIGSLDTLFPQFSSIGGLLFIITVLPTLTYEFSVPQLLVHKQQGKKISLVYLLSVMWTNFKRFLIPGIVFFTLMLISIILLIFISASLFEKQDFEYVFAAWGNYSLDPLSITHIVLNIFFSSTGAFLIFSSIFFSVKRLRLFSSIKKSIIFSYKHILYTLIIFIVLYIAYFISTFISSVSRMGPFSSSLLSEYIYLITLASSLIYYQKHYKD